MQLDWKQTYSEVWEGKVTEGRLFVAIFRPLVSAAPPDKPWAVWLRADVGVDQRTVMVADVGNAATFEEAKQQGEDALRKLLAPYRDLLNE